MTGATGSSLRPKWRIFSDDLRLPEEADRPGPRDLTDALAPDDRFFGLDVLQPSSPRAVGCINATLEGPQRRGSRNSASE
jgi:hypothetical protein